jgi:hypothetical protein
LKVQTTSKITRSQQPVAEGAGIVVTENVGSGDQNPDRVVEPKRSRNNNKKKLKSPCNRPCGPIGL